MLEKDHKHKTKRGTCMPLRIAALGHLWILCFDLKRIFSNRYGFHLSTIPCSNASFVVGHFCIIQEALCTVALIWEKFCFCFFFI